MVFRSTKRLNGCVVRLSTNSKGVGEVRLTCKRIPPTGYIHIHQLNGIARGSYTKIKYVRNVPRNCQSPSLRLLSLKPFTEVIKSDPSAESWKWSKDRLGGFTAERQTHFTAQGHAFVLGSFERSKQLRLKVTYSSFFEDDPEKFARRQILQAQSKTLRMQNLLSAEQHKMGGEKREISLLTRYLLNDDENLRELARAEEPPNHRTQQLHTQHTHPFGGNMIHTTALLKHPPFTPASNPIRSGIVRVFGETATFSEPHLNFSVPHTTPTQWDGTHESLLSIIVTGLASWKRDTVLKTSIFIDQLPPEDLPELFTEWELRLDPWMQLLNQAAEAYL